jgi:excisionase family DNA binding protein
MPENPGIRLAETALLDVRQAAAYLHLSVSKLYVLMDAGELRYVKLGKSRRLRPQDLEQLIQTGLRGG